MSEVLPSQGSIRMEHVPTCCCRYVADSGDTSDVKLLDTRCIAGYLVPAVEPIINTEVLDALKTGRHDLDTVSKARAVFKAAGFKAKPHTLEVVEIRDLRDRIEQLQRQADTLEGNLG